MGIKMKLTAGQKKWIVGFFVFLGLMWLCTLISRSVYASGLAQVTAVHPEERNIVHRVEADGSVKQGSEAAVYTKEGLRVEKIYVREGDTVNPDTVLFRIDMEDLNEKIREKELEEAKLKYQLSDLAVNKEMSEQEKQEEIERAKEDYESAQRKAAAAQGRAGEQLQTAQERLEKHLENGVNVTPEEERQKAEASFQDWLNEGAGLKALTGEKEEQLKNASLAAEVAQAAETAAARKLSEAEQKRQAAQSQVDAADGEVKEAEKKLAEAGTPDESLTQALQEAQTQLKEA